MSHLHREGASAEAYVKAQSRTGTIASATSYIEREEPHIRDRYYRDRIMRDLQKERDRITVLIDRFNQGALS